MASLRRNPAVVALLSAFMLGTVESHMIMKSPVPYGDPDNSPLSSSGSNYPCKVTSDAATFYSTDGIIDQNTMVAGESQTLSFTGSAVHGGGSCQLAITNDMQPSASTSWRVILSIESGCPSTNAASPSTYNYTIPEETEPGQYSFAWTWISKLAGQPEYYMNCAPITVTASSSSKAKRNGVSLLPRADSYPELFVANLESINSCETTSGTDVVYPDPGENVEKLLTGATPSYATITASGCVPLSQTQGSGSLPTATAGGSGSSSGNGSASTTASAGATTSSSSAAASSQETQSASFVLASTTQPTSVPPTTLATTTVAEDTSLAVIPITTHDATSSTIPSANATSGSLSQSPGIQSASQSFTTSSFSSKATSSVTSTTASTVSSKDTSSVVPTATSSAFSTVTSSASSKTTSTASSKITTSATATRSATGGSASATGSSSSNSTSSSGGASVKSGSCTQEGMFNCVGSNYQQCASGSWTTMQALPAGTTCQQGESESLWARSVGTNLLRKARRGAKFAYVQ